MSDHSQLFLLWLRFDQTNSTTHKLKTCWCLMKGAYAISPVWLGKIWWLNCYNSSFNIKRNDFINTVVVTGYCFYSNSLFKGNSMAKKKKRSLIFNKRLRKMSSVSAHCNSQYIFHHKKVFKTWFHMTMLCCFFFILLTLRQKEAGDRTAVYNSKIYKLM